MLVLLGNQWQETAFSKFAKRNATLPGREDERATKRFARVGLREIQKTSRAGRKTLENVSE
jgi:hypothetical protein